MQRFFNRKNTIVFSILLIVCFIAATTLLVARSGYQAKVEAAATSTGDSSSGSELSDKIVDTLSGLLQSATENKDGDTDTADTDTEEEKPVYNAEQLRYLSQAKRCLIFSIILYVLAGLSMGLDVTCAAYDAYTGTDKPKAKKKSKAVAAKCSAATSK